MSTQPFILPRLIPGLSGNLVIKSKLPPRSGFSLEAVEPHPSKGPTTLFFTSKAFDRVWHAGRVHKLKSYGISGQIFGLILSFLIN